MTQEIADVPVDGPPAADPAPEPSPEQAPGPDAEVGPPEPQHEVEVEAAPPAELAPINGFGVPDWLVEPLVDAAVAGLETMARTEVPPRLLPLTGRRHAKVSRATRQEVLSALGRHQRFTDAAFDRLFEANEPEARAMEGRSADEVIASIDRAEADAALVVCLLLGANRAEDAQAVAAWATQTDESSGTLAGIIDALSRENLAALEQRRRLEADLAHERRARKALERKIEKASTTEAAARVRAQKAESQAGWTRVEANAESLRSDQLERELAEAEAALESGRRERRDLLAELHESEERYQRARRELRDLRARVPVEEVATAFELVPDEPPPTTADLRDRFVQFGAKGVLDAKRLLLLVDGWNVSLGHIGAERLEDKRRILEQALERYRSRTGNKVMVVYDGHRVSWFWMPRAEGRTIARVFTEDQTADDYIVGELGAETGRSETPVVATSDRELRKRCIAVGAFVVSSEDLAAVLKL